jgi:hypothetical protein
MTQEHPITPPSKLVEKWIKSARYKEFMPYPEGYEQYEQRLTTIAAQWGADQELEACCEWLSDGWGLPAASDNLCAARRPKPPSLKERALSELDALENMGTCNSETIRRALEALPE